MIQPEENEGPQIPSLSARDAYPQQHFVFPGEIGPKKDGLPRVGLSAFFYRS
jgi:hypothetical protein